MFGDRLGGRGHGGKWRELRRFRMKIVLYESARGKGKKKGKARLRAQRRYEKSELVRRPLRDFLAGGKWGGKKGKKRGGTRSYRGHSNQTTLEEYFSAPCGEERSRRG